LEVVPAEFETISEDLSDWDIIPGDLTYSYFLFWLARADESNELLWRVGSWEFYFLIVLPLLTGICDPDLVVMSLTWFPAELLF